MGCTEDGMPSGIFPSMVFLSHLALLQNIGSGLLSKSKVGQAVGGLGFVGKETLK